MEELIKKPSIKGLIIDMLIYILKYSPIEKNDLLNYFSKSMNISLRTVDRNVLLLEEKGLIKIKKKDYTHSGTITVNVGVWRELLKDRINYE